MDWKLRSLWSWSRPASEAHQSDTAVPNEEGFSSEDYISEEEKGPRVNLVNWSGKSRVPPVSVRPTLMIQILMSSSATLQSTTSYPIV
jgi:hypothetical protein